jgi:hypothetical protein
MMPPGKIDWGRDDTAWLGGLTLCLFDRAHETWAIIGFRWNNPSMGWEVFRTPVEIRQERPLNNSVGAGCQAKSIADLSKLGS